jgi:DNA repair protein RadC
MDQTDVKVVNTDINRNGHSNIQYMSKVGDRFYHVHQIKHSPKIINKNDKDEAYDHLLKDWDKDVMDWVKEYKTLVLNRSNKPIFMITFEALGKVTNDNISKLFDIIKSLPNAYKIIIGQNSPERSVLPDEEDKNVAAQFKEFGRRNNIEVVQQLIMSPNSLYAFNQHELSNKNTVHK